MEPDDYTISIDSIPDSWADLNITDTIDLSGIVISSSGLDDEIHDGKLTKLQLELKQQIPVDIMAKLCNNNSIA